MELDPLECIDIVSAYYAEDKKRAEYLKGECTLEALTENERETV